MDRLGPIQINIDRKYPFTRFGSIGLMDDHALGEQVGKRFLHFNVSRLAHGAHIKPRIEQVQNGVLNAADILVDRHPISCGTCLNRLIAVR